MTSPYNFQAAADPKMQSIVVKKHGQYLLSPSKPGGNLPALVGFHGYADTAEQHLEMLKAIPTNDPWLCCAVQSLNLFYTKSMKIVGNWMTSFDRENAIIDNVNYVDEVVSELQNAFKASKQLVYLGFPKVNQWPTALPCSVGTPLLAWSSSQEISRRSSRPLI